MSVTSFQEIEKRAIERHGEVFVARIQGKPDGGVPVKYGDTNGTPAAAYSFWTNENPRSPLAIHGNKLHLLFRI